MAGKKVDICDFRIPHSDAGNLRRRHIFRTIQRQRNRNRCQYTFGSQQQCGADQEAYSLYLLIHTINTPCWMLYHG